MKKLHLVGFGSQGAVWAELLRKAGWEVFVYARNGHPSYNRAIKSGFSPFSLEELTRANGIIALLCADHAVSEVYERFLSKNPNSICIVLGHGFAVYEGKLQINSQHELCLLAPKAISSELLHKGLSEKNHSLAAAISLNEDSKFKREILALAMDLGFSENNLIPATFEQEAVADLISEQGLLCGGLFTLLAWTVEKMKKENISERLIKEECFHELTLLANAIHKLGPAAAFDKISDNAKKGAELMFETLTPIRSSFEQRLNEVSNKEFLKNMSEKKHQLRDLLEQVLGGKR
ncbi:MAG: hypothetical protein AB7F43_09905 [Bacteriovoracia bacterium]